MKKKIPVIRKLYYFYTNLAENLIEMYEHFHIALCASKINV